MASHECLQGYFHLPARNNCFAGLGQGSQRTGTSELSPETAPCSRWLLFPPKRQLVPQPPVMVLVKFFMGSTKCTQIRSLGGDRVVPSLCWVWAPASGYGRKRGIRQAESCSVKRSASSQENQCTDLKHVRCHSPVQKGMAGGESTEEVIGNVCVQREV